MGGPNKIQVIVKQFPDYEESFDNYSSNYKESKDYQGESEGIARNEVTDRHITNVSETFLHPTKSLDDSNKIQAIVKHHPDYEESFDNYPSDYEQGRDYHGESEEVAGSKVMDKHTRYVSDSDSQSTENLTKVKKAREESIIDNHKKGSDSMFLARF